MSKNTLMPNGYIHGAMHQLRLPEEIHLPNAYIIFIATEHARPGI
ncbi:hypothetical protein [Thiomicrorhabdus sp.]|nr:hypothetical protein [Thiomicrorhabdus sp.]